MKSECLFQFEFSSNQQVRITLFGFGRGYQFSDRKDLRSIASQLPEGVALCSASLIAGQSHLQSVLIQCGECWCRGIFLARNRSIDLLMRLTCQNQISKAIQASSLESSTKVGLVGLTKSLSDLTESENLIEQEGGRRNDLLLAVDTEKLDYLRSFHSLPSSIGEDRLPELLQERSALLVFPS